MIRHTPFYDVLSAFDTFNQATRLPAQRMRSGTTSPGVRSSGMLIDCYTTPDYAVVIASMPGIHPDDVDVSVNKDTLTIHGSVSGDRRQQDEHGDPVTWYLSEIPRGTYERRLKLPFPIEEDGVEAQFANGMLRIVLPKMEAAKPRSISVEVLESRFPEIAAEAEEEEDSYSAD